MHSGNLLLLKCVNHGPGAGMNARVQSFSLRCPQGNFGMDNSTEQLQAELSQLIAEALTFPPTSAERRQRLHRLYVKVMRSGKLWRDRAAYYNDALQDTWEYCFQHLEDYDPTLNNVTTWIDNQLKKRLRTYRDRQSRDRQRHASTFIAEDGQRVDPAERIVARPDPQPALDLWQKTLHWVQTDPDNVLRNKCFRKRPEINAQVLILKRLPPESESWAAIANEFNLNPAEAKDLPKWYNRYCKPLLREFGQAQGYL